MPIAEMHYRSIAVANIHTFLNRNDFLHLQNRKSAGLYDAFILSCQTQREDKQIHAQNNHYRVNEHLNGAELYKEFACMEEVEEHHYCCQHEVGDTYDFATTVLHAEQSAHGDNECHPNHKQHHAGGCFTRCVGHGNVGSPESWKYVGDNMGHEAQHDKYPHKGHFGDICFHNMKYKVCFESRITNNLSCAL